MNLNDAVKPELKRQWGKLFGKLTLLLRYLWRVPISGVENPQITFSDACSIMRKAKVTLSWTLSTSKDVVKQEIKVLDPDDGTVFLDKIVDATVTSVTVEEALNEKQKIQGVIVTSDGLNKSDAVIVDSVVPDLTAPKAVTGAKFSYEVVETDEKDSI